MSKRMHLTCATRKNCARPCESAGLGHACNSETSVRSAITAGLQKDPGICWETNREPLLEGLLLAIQQQKLEWPGKVLVQPLPTPARADVESWWKDNKALAQLLWLDAMGFLLSMPQPPRELGAGAELETELRKLQVDEAHRGKLQKVFERLVLTHVLLRHGLTAQQRIAALVNRGERVMIVLPEELGDDQRTRVLDALLLGVPTRFNPISAEELGPLDDEIGIPDYAAVPPAETQETTAMTIEFLELGDPRIGDFIDDTGAGAPVWVHAADPSALQSAHLRGMKESRVLRISQDVIKDLASAKQRIPTLGSELESRRSTQG